MKKLIASLLVGGLAALVVVGCGPSPTSEPTPPVKPGTTTSTSTSSSKTTTTSGKVTKVEKGKLEIKTDAGDTKSYTIPDDVKVGDDIKADTAVTVTETDGKVTKVEKK